MYFILYTIKQLKKENIQIRENIFIVFIKNTFTHIVQGSSVVSSWDPILGQKDPKPSVQILQCLVI